MNGCMFCELMSEKNRAIYYEDSRFVAMWSSLPVFPGHTLIIPKRHIQRFHDMNDEEMCQVAFSVATAKTKIEQADLTEVCAGLEVINDHSKELIERATDYLKDHEYTPPKAFNDGVNDGVEAGQEVPHLHWHILPRWSKSDGQDIVSRFTTEPDTL